MKEYFKTKRDINGNTYTLIIDHEKKTFSRDYNPFNYSGYITITRKERATLINNLQESNYQEV